MRDVVFLFGAGASAGAGSILPERPPLGAELFAELRRLFPGSWGALPQNVQDRLLADFEAGMAAVVEHIGMAVPQLMRDMAVYFIQFRSVNASSLYDRLVADIRARGLLSRVAFSTLNYECILEFSILGHGVNIDYFGDGLNDQVPVWKLHGSCNMFSAGLHAGPGIGYGPGVVFEGGIQAWLDANKVIQHCLVETALAPVMCQYMKGKPTSVSPSAVRELQKRWSDAVAHARAIVCIGVRPHPPDAHVWDSLAATPAGIHYIGDERSFYDWTSKHRLEKPSRWLGARFNTAYTRLIGSLEASCT